MSDFEHDPLTQKIIGCCFEVHRELGPEFPEKIYAKALQIVLSKHHLSFASEKEFNVNFDGQQIGKFRCDLLVESRIIVELKSVTGFIPKLFQNQVLSCLKASNTNTGLLVNFGNTSCEIKRLSL